jgi:hypothetical protein
MLGSLRMLRTLGYIHPSFPYSCSYPSAGRSVRLKEIGCHVFLSHTPPSRIRPADSSLFGDFDIDFLRLNLLLLKFCICEDLKQGSEGCVSQW